MPDAISEIEVEDAMTAETPVEPSVEVEVEVPVPAEPADAAPAEPPADAAPAEPSTEPPVEPGPDYPAMLAALTSERDVALGQAAEAMAMIPPMQAELAVLRERCANYELGSALAGEGLPSTAGPLVLHLYSTMNSQSAYPMGLSDWLKTYLGTPEGAALALLKGAPAQDPRSGTAGSTASTSSSTGRPVFGSPTR